MAPTVQRPGGAAGAAHKPSRQGDGEERKDLICRVKYCNNLPDIPFDPKFIAYPFDTQRFISYNPTGLERNYKYELLTEHDLGVTIDLINPEAYSQVLLTSLIVPDSIVFIPTGRLRPHGSC